MRIFSRKSAILFAAALFVCLTDTIVFACTVREEALPQLMQDRATVDLLEKTALAFFAGIIGLYFLNIFINRQWLHTLLFPFAALLIFFASIVYTVIFALDGFCGTSEAYRAALITLILTAALLASQLILFVMTMRRGKFKAA